MSWKAGRPSTRIVSWPTMYLPASSCSSVVLPAGAGKNSEGGEQRVGGEEQWGVGPTAAAARQQEGTHAQPARDSPLPSQRSGHSRRAHPRRWRRTAGSGCRGAAPG